MMKPLTLVHLYPREMNIYGDTGNVLVLRRRLQWRGLPVEVVAGERRRPAARTTPTSCSAAAGRTPPRARSAPTSPPAGAELRAMADDGVVMLGDLRHLPDARPRVRHPRGPPHRRRRRARRRHARPARAADRQQLRRHPGRRPAGRLREPQRADRRSGRASRRSAARRPGAATTARDGTEGAVRDNVIGTYLHGPVLAKSPRFADDLLRRAYARRGDADRARAARRRAGRAGRPGRRRPPATGTPSAAGEHASRRARGRRGRARVAGCTSASSPSRRDIDDDRRTTGPAPGTRRRPAASPAAGQRRCARCRRARKPPSGEVEAGCPYIRTGLDQEPTSGPQRRRHRGRPGLPDDRADHGCTPVGCRFYFSCAALRGGRRHPAATLPTAAGRPQRDGADRARPAHDLSSGRRTSSRASTASATARGSSARTAARDWAFVFAKGKVLVVVHTQQHGHLAATPVTSRQAIVGKF